MFQIRPGIWPPNFLTKHGAILNKNCINYLKIAQTSLKYLGTCSKWGKECQKQIFWPNIIKKILENDQNDLKIAKNGTKIVQNGLKCLGKWSKSGQESQTQIAWPKVMKNWAKWPKWPKQLLWGKQEHHRYMLHLFIYCIKF